MAKKKKNMKQFFQQLAKAFLAPMALMTVCGLLQGISSLFINGSVVELLPFLNQPGIQYVATLFNKTGGIVLNYLPLVYAVTIAFSLAHEDKEHACFAALMGYLAFIMSMNILITSFESIADMFPINGITTILGLSCVNCGVLGGIMVGVITALLHNRFKNNKLPMAFAFFSGVRFIPFLAMVVMALIGQVFPFIWLPLCKGINALAQVVMGCGVAGPGIYGMTEKLLIPTGLHNIWNTVLLDTAASGLYTFPSGVVEGVRTAYYQSLVEGLPLEANAVELAAFLRGGQMPYTIFVAPAIALAIYKCAKTENRAKIKPLVTAGAITAVVAGITEPLEFIFLFSAPALYIIYAIIGGLNWTILYALKAATGGRMGSLLGLIIFGILRPETKWIYVVILGLIEAVLMYKLFTWWIIKFDVKTPGRGGDYDDSLAFAAEVANVDLEIGDKQKKLELETNPEILKARMIIQALGGKDNIVEVDSCMSRLRVVFKDESLIDKALLNRTGCQGIVVSDETNIQIIYGVSVGLIKKSILKELN